MPQDDLAEMLADICRPRPHQLKLGLVLGAIESARARLVRATMADKTPAQVGGMAMTEIAKIIAAKTAYDLAVGGDDRPPCRRCGAAAADIGLNADGLRSCDICHGDDV